eukprot:Gb_31056 [translate_table: standard]
MGPALRQAIVICKWSWLLPRFPTLPPPPKWSSLPPAIYSIWKGLSHQTLNFLSLTIPLPSYFRLEILANCSYPSVATGGHRFGLSPNPNLRWDTNIWVHGVLGQLETFIGDHWEHSISIGVIHAGIYYEPGSAVAKLCVEGARRMYEYCEKKQLPHKRVGKLIVATHEHELPLLEDLYHRGVANKVEGLELLSPKQILDMEPNVCALRALHSPNTGITDYGAIARSFAEDFIASGRGQICTRLRSPYIVFELGNKFLSLHEVLKVLVINQLEIMLVYAVDCCVDAYHLCEGQNLNVQVGVPLVCSIVQFIMPATEPKCLISDGIEFAVLAQFIFDSLEGSFRQNTAALIIAHKTIKSFHILNIQLAACANRSTLFVSSLLPSTEECKLSLMPFSDFRDLSGFGQ